MSTLTKYKRNVYSQNGEDGVIAEICSRMRIKLGTFVEFGAWDGKHLSNTYHLVEQGWEGVYIEGNADRFKDLVRNMYPFQARVKTIEAYVEMEGYKTLDNLLANIGIPKELDLLSIDIDSYDWHVWKSLNNFLPKIVIIEINSSIPVGVFQTHRNNGVQGSSFTATVELGKDKGYTPVCHTGNLIFVRNDYLDMITLPNQELKYPELLMDYEWKRLSWEEPIPPSLRRFFKIFKRIKSFFKQA